jgi:hypothetical protein
LDQIRVWTRFGFGPDSGLDQNLVWNRFGLDQNLVGTRFRFDKIRVWTRFGFGPDSGLDQILVWTRFGFGPEFGLDPCCFHEKDEARSVPSFDSRDGVVK